MKKRLFLLLFCLNLIPLYMLAQFKGWKPGGIAEAGFVAGTAEPSYDWRTQFTMSKKLWSVGLGAGVDDYKFRSVPVVLQGRRYFGQRKLKLFALASGGLNIVTDKSEPQNNWWWTWSSFRSSIMPSPIINHYQNGYYAELGTGIAFLSKKQHGFILGLSWSRKTTTEWYETEATMTSNPTDMDRTTNRYQLNRMVLRLGYKW